MGQPAVGTITLVNFPFADLKGYKKRPAIIVALGSMQTAVLCQITSRRLANTPSVSITAADFALGTLPVTSYVRPDKLFTVDSDTARKQAVGKVSDKKLREIRRSVIKFFE